MRSQSQQSEALAWAVPINHEDLVILDTGRWKRFPRCAKLSLLARCGQSSTPIVGQHNKAHTDGTVERSWMILIHLRFELAAELSGPRYPAVS